MISVIPCTGLHALKPKLLENRCTIKHAFIHICIRFLVEYTVQYIYILKSYLNLNKYMAKKRVLWCIYFKVLEVLMHTSQYKVLRYLQFIIKINKNYKEFKKYFQFNYYFTKIIFSIISILEAQIFRTP